MLNKLICKNLIYKQFNEIIQDNRLNYERELNYIKLGSVEDDCDIIVTFLSDGTYSLMVTVDSCMEYIDISFDVQVIYLLYILKDKLKKLSFSEALKETLKKYKEMKDEIGGLGNENSTN